MALVNRNGRAYLYRSVRRGGRVTSEYRGSGDAAFSLGSILQQNRQWEEARRSAERAERREADELERALDDLAELAGALAHQALTAAGYHRHNRGEWRKRRHANRRGKG